MIKAAIVGGTGYTGAELLRILASHPEVEVKTITARAEAGVKIKDFYPHLIHSDLAFVKPEEANLEDCEVVFFATPHGVCMKEAEKLLKAGCKIIDLSADFRIKDPELFKKWYGLEHSSPELLKEAVYGISEINREQIKKARLIANAGCYPTAVQLGFKPLLENNLIELFPLIADVKSGVSGAGRGAKIPNLYAEMGESFKAYGFTGHRHQVEIEEQLSYLAQSPINLTFVPHLVPMIRGIEATLYAPLKNPQISSEEIQEFFINAYKDEFFIEVLDIGKCPETRAVRGSNFVQLAISRSVDKRLVLVSVVEDNLVKGAAGQAVQNMNLIFGFKENLGLTQIALMP